MVEPMKAPIPARRAVLLRAWSAVVLMTAPMGSVDQRKGGVGAGLGGGLGTRSFGGVPPRWPPV
ncbi:hypothetical protein MTP06_57520 [Streptomyces sp. PLM4]|uniref:Uncharacterized protein n=1 Tax=Streptomyces albidoflavus TaxID=1886 RepID=A0AA37BT97_9ACTN|nr:hypothetical protein MTP02_02270 [Streptomyces albus]BDH72303.1 hypothetical protein MTP06_57520 [Streptomyces sp. PLM4]GHI44287.1 hypothetical protein ScoT_04610 [Streptomyces albidoflavus]